MPQVSFFEEKEETRVLWKKLAALPTASPKDWMDAYLAAYAMAAGIVLTTGDREFFLLFEKKGLSQFAGGVDGCNRSWLPSSETGSPRFFIEVAHVEAASYFICIVNSITAY